MLRLTKLEKDILEHRLNVQECIADALEGDFQREQVERVCDLLLEEKWDEALAVGGEPLLFAVLEDAVDGNTYYGSEVGNGRPQKEAAFLRAGQSLATKVSELIGRKVVYPAY